MHEPLVSMLTALTAFAVQGDERHACGKERAAVMPQQLVFERRHTAWMWMMVQAFLVCKGLLHTSNTLPTQHLAQIGRFSHLLQLKQWLQGKFRGDLLARHAGCRTESPYVVQLTQDLC